MSSPWDEELRHEACRSHERPVLLGYIRADVLNGTGLPQVRAELEAFADREEFSLGTVYVAQGDASATFHALMEEATRDEAWGVVVPDLRHVTVVEHVVLTCYDDGIQTSIFAAAASSPHAGGPGLGAPDSRRARRSSFPIAPSNQRRLT